MVGIRPEFVKIDRHFISGIDADPLKPHFVSAMHEFADACDSAPIAEGVETEAQLAVLRDLGITYLQRIGIAPPQRRRRSRAFRSGCRDWRDAPPERHRNISVAFP